LENPTSPKSYSRPYKTRAGNFFVHKASYTLGLHACSNLTGQAFPNSFDVARKYRPSVDCRSETVYCVSLCGNSRSFFFSLVYLIPAPILTHIFNPRPDILHLNFKHAQPRESTAGSRRLWVSRVLPRSDEFNRRYVHPSYYCICGRCILHSTACIQQSTPPPLQARPKPFSTRLRAANADRIIRLGSFWGGRRRAWRPGGPGSDRRRRRRRRRRLAAGARVGGPNRLFAWHHSKQVLSLSLQNPFSLSLFLSLQEK
jgi:hypothetical protein